MKQLHIYTTSDSTGSAISLGSYWACNGGEPVLTAWEFIGDEQELYTALESLRDEQEAEFMHVVSRSMHR